MKTFEIVHFSPDPYVDRRIPIGAFVGHGASKRLLLAPAPPEWQCAGGWRGAAIAADAIEALRSWDANSDGVPMGFEEVLVRSSACPIPESWQDDEIRARLFGESEPAPKQASRRPTAVSLGKQFLARRGVLQLVEEDLHPETFAEGRYKAAMSAGTMRQFVSLEDRLLVLEPLRPDAAQRWVESVARRLSVWKCAAQKHRWSQVKVLAYAVPLPANQGADSVNDTRVLDHVRDFADSVYDARQSEDAEALTHRIKVAS